MKRIEHTVFAEPETRIHPFWALFFATTGEEKKRERIRRQAETFIDETGLDNIVSVIEHAPVFGPFSVVVWWYRELPDADTSVIRASGGRLNT
jgi:hypothetical protein